MRHYDAETTTGSAGCGESTGINRKCRKRAYHASLDASRIIYDTRVKLVEFFGGDHAEQVAFTANSTESLNLAIKGLFYPGDHIITTALEHNSVLRPLYEMEEKGTELTILKSDEKGCISYEEMENAIRENTGRSSARMAQM